MVDDMVLLRAARRLISKGWNQNHAALDYYDEPANPWSVDARSWCLVGAVEAYKKFPAEAIIQLKHLLFPDRFVHITTWNDRNGRTQEEVLALINSAIARLKETNEAIRLQSKRPGSNPRALQDRRVPSLISSE